MTVMTQKFRKKVVTQERPLTFLEAYFSPRSLQNAPVLQNPASVFVFDIESDGERYLVGFSGATSFNYRSLVVQSEDDLEFLFRKWNTLGYKFGFAFNLKYDLPALLMFGNRYEYAHALRNLGEFYYTRNYEIVRKKLFFEVKRKPVNGEPPSTILFYDLLQYYQMSLFNSYNAFKQYIPKQFKLTEEEEKEWKEDKKKRGSITDVTDKDVIYYNALDVKVTVGLLHVADDNIKRLSKVLGKPLNMGITLPLTAEYAISSDLNMVDYHLLDPKDRTDLYNALALSYRGGFFNSPKLGAIYTNVFKYDVNSMYPFMMTMIPSLRYVGRANHPSEDQITSPFDLVCGQFSGNTAVPTKVMKQSLVLEHTAGCLWAFEIKPELFANWLYTTSDFHMVLPNPYSQLKIDYIYAIFKYEPTGEFPLRDPITRLYKERLTLKKKGNPYEKVVKIVMNSSYGKYGEMVFVSPGKERLEYASLITAMGRVFINSLLPRDKIVTYLTDSIVSTEPLPGYMIGDDLGLLKEETPDFYDVFLNVNNGIYSFIKNRQIMDDYTHTRGFAKMIGDKQIAQKFFIEYLNMLDYATTPYQIKLNAKKTVMVRSNSVLESLLKSGNYEEVDSEDLQTRGIKGRLVEVPTTISGFNKKYIYSPFRNRISEGSIIKDYFTSFILNSVFSVRSRGFDLTRLKVLPVMKDRANEIELECKSIDYYRLALPDAWNVLRILCGGDHPIEKRLSIDAIKSFSTKNERGELVRAIPIIHPPGNNFISNTAYMAFVRPPYRLKYITDKDDGIDVRDYVPDVIDQIENTDLGNNNPGNPGKGGKGSSADDSDDFPDDLLGDLVMLIDQDIEIDELSVEY